MVLTIENAMQFDFNLMVEDFGMYKMLPPRLQTQIVDICFEDFVVKFHPFFSECEAGFRNECIVNMFVRRINAGSQIFGIGVKLQQMYFLTSG